MSRVVCVAIYGIGLLLAGCKPSPQGVFQGYVEGEYVYVAPPLGGTLTKLSVARGQEVKAGEVLFELEKESEQAATREAAHRLDQAKARLENLMKGKRPSEIASLEAQLKRAEASLRLSKLELERQTKLNESKVVSEAELDVARSRREADEAQVAALTADLETARLGARVDEIKAAQAEVEAANAALAKAQWAVNQKVQTAPVEGRVHDTLYRQGEYIQAGGRVVSMLPPANLKVRFFVPQEKLDGFKPGTGVQVSLDGVAAPLRATVNYISTQAEFTPPIIYSKETRAKLVFMIEAVFAPAEAAGLKPGQPADIRLTP